MSKEIVIDIIDRVKKYLQIEDNLSSVELLHLLKEHRKRIHPDKFSEEHAKKEAENKFKSLGELIDELDNFIQNDMLQRPAKEVALYEPIYDNFLLQKNLDRALKKSEELNSTIKYLKEENEDLQKVINEKRSNELEHEEREIKNLYKPSSRSLFSLGITFLLALVLAIMTRIDNISELLKKYSPLDNQIINNTIFILFILLLIIIIKQYVENLLLRRKIQTVCSTSSFKLFYKQLVEKKQWNDKNPKEFNELDVFDFIYGSKDWYKTVLSKLGFNLYHVGTYEKVKDYFINTLLNKKLIKVYYAKELDRTFTIKDGKSYYYYSN